MQKILKPLSLSRSLGLTGVTDHGRVQYGFKGDRGYVLAAGTIYETRPGTMRSCSGVTASEFTSVSGAKPLSGNEFVSASGTVIDQVLPQDTEIVSVSSGDVQANTLKLAQHIDSLLSVFDSVSASNFQYWTYQGRDLDIRTAHNKYDLKIVAGTNFTMSWVKDDGYALRVRGEVLPYYIFGHKVAQNILSRSVIENPIGAVASNTADEFKYIGTLDADVMAPVRIAKGTNLYSARHRVYLEYNLKCSVNEMAPAYDIANLLARTTAYSGVPDLVGKFTLNSPPVSTEKSRTVWGAALPVSGANRKQVQLYFADSAQRIQALAQDHIVNNRMPAPYFMFEASSFSNYYNAWLKGRTVITTLEKLQRDYELTEVRSPVDLNTMIVTEPLANPPAPEYAFTAHYARQLTQQIRLLIESGYFITGLMLDVKQNASSIRFSSSNMDQQKYNSVVLAADRIRAWLYSNGSNVMQKHRMYVERESDSVVSIILNPPRGKFPKSVKLMQELPPVIGASYRISEPGKAPAVLTAETAYIDSGEVCCIDDTETRYVPYEYMTLIV